jgi:hypothetical protein
MTEQWNIESMRHKQKHRRLGLAVMRILGVRQRCWRVYLRGLRLLALPIPQVLILMEGLPGSLLSLGYGNEKLHLFACESP